MTQLIPAKSTSIPDEAARHQRLMELVEAEDAANGEVGCGRDWGARLSGYLSTRGLNLEDEKLRSLLREYLGNTRMEPDFDSITTQIQRQIEYIVVQAPSKYLSSASLPTRAKITEHIPTNELRDLFQAQIAEFCSEDTLEQLIQFSHQIIHKAVLQPRHTWSKPIWVLKGETQIYIAQAAGIKEAIAKVKSQHPQETAKLEAITVGGVLAPDQVTSLDTALL